LALVWGGKSYLQPHPATATEYVVRDLKQANHIRTGDAVVVASGHQPGVAGGTDTVTIQMVQ